MEMVLRRMKVEGATVHAFRSSFRDWAGNVSSFPDGIGPRHRRQSRTGLPPQRRAGERRKLMEA
jgi:hypothetical protein